MTALLASAALFAAVAAPEQTSAHLRRFALVAGANDGGGDRVRLRYAASDARAFARVVEELGGVVAEDRLLLLGPSRAELEEAFIHISRRIETSLRPGERSEVIVYYSGHSDAEGLLLAGERIPYAALRAAVDAARAEVRVVILDSCASGALTRFKGGVARPAFLSDTSAQIKGHAFLMASSADEAAQESDRVEGSFFTHSLVSGLRGAADTSGDGRVTLSEAYQFAFHETLSRTERTRGGPQHPAYDIALAGTGDLVLTDLRGTGATLVLPAGMEGRFFLRDAEGILVAELRKPAGRAVELGLAPARYRLAVDRLGALYAATVELARGQRRELAPAELALAVAEPAVARGGPAVDSTVERDATAEDARAQALRTYLKKRIYFLDDSPFREGPGPFMGDRRALLESADFYERVGRPDLAAAYREQVASNTAWGWAGVGTAVGGLGLFLASIIGADALEQRGVPEEVLMGTALGGLVVGIAGEVVGAVYASSDPNPVSIEEMKELAAQHNRRLKEELGLLNEDVE